MKTASKISDIEAKQAELDPDDREFLDNFRKRNFQEKDSTSDLNMFFTKLMQSSQQNKQYILEHYLLFPITHSVALRKAVLLHHNWRNLLLSIIQPEFSGDHLQPAIDFDVDLVKTVIAIIAQLVRYKVTTERDFGRWLTEIVNAIELRFGTNLIGFELIRLVLYSSTKIIDLVHITLSNHFKVLHGIILSSYVMLFLILSSVILFKMKQKPKSENLECMLTMMENY